MFVGWMDGWVGEWMDGWMAVGWMDGWWLDGWMDQRIDQWVSEQLGR